MLNIVFLKFNKFEVKPPKECGYLSPSMKQDCNLYSQNRIYQICIQLQALRQLAPANKTIYQVHQLSLKFSKDNLTISLKLASLEFSSKKASDVS